ncbi:MAG: hypothetical protein ACREC8_00995 [Limisphaerales bacterium]
MKPSKTPGICRIDQPSHRTHGFFVRVHCRKKIHSGFFADKMHGGRSPAFAAAQKFHKKIAGKIRGDEPDAPAIVGANPPPQRFVGHRRRAAIRFLEIGLQKGLQKGCVESHLESASGRHPAQGICGAKARRQKSPLAGH